MESSDEEQWKQLAEAQWSKSSAKVRKVRPEFVKSEIWDVLEKEDFAFRSLLILDNLQLLEKFVSAHLTKRDQSVLIDYRYLWPGYDDSSSNYQVLLIALMVVVKQREGLPVWSTVYTMPKELSITY